MRPFLASRSRFPLTAVSTVTSSRRYPEESGPLDQRTSETVGHEERRAGTTNLRALLRRGLRWTCWRPLRRSTGALGRGSPGHGHFAQRVIMLGQPVGHSPSGAPYRRPKSSVVMSASPTFCSTRGEKRQAWNVAAFSRSVISSSAPPSTKSNTAGAGVVWPAGAHRPH